VDPGHRGQAEAVQLLADHRHAHHPAAEAHGQAHELGGGRVRGEDDVTLVLAVGVVDDEDGAARTDLGHRTLDRVEHRLGMVPVGVALEVVLRCHRASSWSRSSWRWTYLPMTSTSTLTRSPTALCPNVVSSIVVGIKIGRAHV